MEAAVEARQGQDGAGGDGDPRPLGEYGTLMGLYNAAVAGWLWRRRGRLPERVRPWDLLLMGIATHKLSRMISKDKVTAPIRAPFAEFEGDAGPAEVSESTKDGSVRGAVGELITCPYCLGQWVATGFGVGLVEAPRPTRFLTAVFTAVAISDFLQVAYKVAEDQLD